MSRYKYHPHGRQDVDQDFKNHHDIQYTSNEAPDPDMDNFPAPSRVTQSPAKSDSQIRACIHGLDQLIERVRLAAAGHALATPNLSIIGDQLTIRVQLLPIN